MRKTDKGQPFPQLSTIISLDSPVSFLSTMRSSLQCKVSLSTHSLSLKSQANPDLELHKSSSWVQTKRPRVAS